MTTWIALVTAAIGIGGAAYLAVSAHWRCDDLERWRAEVDPQQTGRHAQALSDEAPTAHQQHLKREGAPQS